MNRATLHERPRRMRFEHTLDRYERGELSQLEEAEMPGVSERMCRRWEARAPCHKCVDRSGPVMGPASVICAEILRDGHGRDDRPQTPPPALRRAAAVVRRFW